MNICRAFLILSNFLPDFEQRKSSPNMYVLGEAGRIEDIDYSVPDLGTAGPS